MIECRAHRSNWRTVGGDGYSDLPVRLEAEFRREVRRGKAEPWVFVPRASAYGLEKLVTWAVFRLETVELAIDELPEWELGWRPAIAARTPPQWHLAAA